MWDGVGSSPPKIRKIPYCVIPHFEHSTLDGKQVPQKYTLTTLNEIAAQKRKWLRRNSWPVGVADEGAQDASAALGLDAVLYVISTEGWVGLRLDDAQQ